MELHLPSVLLGFSCVCAHFPSEHSVSQMVKEAEAEALCVAVEIRSAQTLLPDFSSKNLKAHLEVLILHGPGVGLL